MENKVEIKVEEMAAVEAEKAPKSKEENKKNKENKKEYSIKTEKVKENTTFHKAFIMLKDENNSRSGLTVSIVGFVLSLFVLLVTLTVKAQTGFIVVALILLIAYMIVIAILALVVDFIAIMLTRRKLKDTCSLIGFIIAIISILTIVSSVAIIYLT
jgi:Flp pilus assembly protein TadB